MPREPMAPRHGGALLAAAQRWRISPERWLDLSTGINPQPYPAPALTASDLGRLPDPAALAALIEAARSAYGAAASTSIAAVPGSDMAMRLLPFLVPPGRAAILSPTYSGHAEGWSGAGHQVAPVATLAAAAGADSIILANPNNPDGRLRDPESVLAALRSLPPHGMLLVDEAFADLVPASSVVPRLSDPRLVVLRSFGKFFGLAGLRLGFVLGNGGIVRRLGDLAGEWPVSGPAVRIGTAALGDRDGQAAIRAQLGTARKRLDALLRLHGLPVKGGTDLFRLVRCTDSAGLHAGLAAHGILTRIFDGIPGVVRFGLPPEAGFARLGAALADIRTRERS